MGGKTERGANRDASHRRSQVGNNVSNVQASRAIRIGQCCINGKEQGLRGAKQPREITRDRV